MLLKMDLRVLTEAKSDKLKNEIKSILFSTSGDAQESVNTATINTFEVHLMMQLAVYLITHRELFLNVHFKIYLNVHKKKHLRLH